MQFWLEAEAGAVVEIVVFVVVGGTAGIVFVAASIALSVKGSNSNNDRTIVKSRNLIKEENFLLFMLHLLL